MDTLGKMGFPLAKNMAWVSEACLTSIPAERGQRGRVVTPNVTGRAR